MYKTVILQKTILARIGGVMRKFYLLLTLMLISTVLLGCSLIEDVKEIEVINLSNGDKTVIEGESEIAKSIVSAVKSKEKTNEDLSQMIAYELVLKKSSQQEYYKLSLDLENNKAYVSQKDMNFLVDTNIAKNLFLDENFYYAYIESTMYHSFLDYNEKKLYADVAYNWTYKNSEGHFINKEGTIKGNVGRDDIVIGEEDVIDIAYEKSPDSQVVKVYSENNLLVTGTSIQEVLDKIVADGIYNIECEAQWLLKDNSLYYGRQILKFDVVIDKPAKINIITKENFPGNILLVSVENISGDDKLNLKTNAVKITTDMYSYKGKSIFVCPIDLNVQPGDYELNVVVNEGSSGEYTLQSTVSIKEKAFKTQYLTVTEEMNESNNDNTAIYEFAQLVKPARTESLNEKLWEGTFLMPVEGRLTTDFAEIRFVNNEQSSSRHSGLDIAAPLGTNIQAPNNGVVTFSMEGLLSPGSTVVIDHGMGLFTSYYHLNTIDVKKGQKVKKGEIIGTVGTTGFSTGPHLHYAVSIYNSYVNPYQTLSGIID